MHSLVAAALMSLTPHSGNRDLDVILYGAYGCVGHIAAFHLANVTGLKWAISGRNESRLRALAHALEETGGASSHPEVIVASLTGNLTSWVSRSRAVATAAGPFSIHNGENLVRACASLGTHYADTSDEFYWQREMIERYDTAARASGARISLASGFCVVAGDLGASLALSSLRTANANVGVGNGVSFNSSEKVDAWLEEYSGGLSAGMDCDARTHDSDTLTALDLLPPLTRPLGRVVDRSHRHDARQCELPQKLGQRPLRTRAFRCAISKG
jgi:hypothetical protein